MYGVETEVMSSKSILNLTQHPASAEQVGVVEPKDKEIVKALLTFNDLPSMGEVISRAKDLTNVAKEHDAKHVMIGGAPWLMAPLENELKDAGITPHYAFSKRVSVEKDGKKISIFKHLGFVPPIE